MSHLEFSNNGVVDSLTHSPAPAIFLENVKREHSNALREMRPISILSIQARDSTNVTSAQLIEMARLITKHMRSGEFYSRISESGFWISVRGSEAAAITLSQRIMGQRIMGQRIMGQRIMGQRIMGQGLMSQGILSGRETNTNTESESQYRHWCTSVIECAPSQDLNSWIKSIDLAHFQSS